MKISTRTGYSIIAFFVTVVIYILTAAPDVSFTDSGELAGVCATLGVAHPTGYPLFTILGYLWTLLPLPFTKIYSLNIFVGILTAVSAAVFFHNAYIIISLYVRNSVRIKSGQKGRQKSKQSQKPDSVSGEAVPADTAVCFISLTTALIYGFAQTIWQEALAVEVYSLQLLLMNLVLFCFLKAVNSDRNYTGYFVISALLLGMAFTNHGTTLLLAPGLFYLYFRRPGGRFDFSAQKWKMLAFLIIPFIAGLSFYLYLPLRAAAMPEFNWGWVSRSWDKFIYHISGKQYQVFMFTGQEAFNKNLKEFFNLIPWQLGWIGIIPLVYGILQAFRKSRDTAVFLLLLVIGCLAYSLNYAIHDIDTYFSIAFIGLILFTGIGLYAFSKFLPGKAAYSFLIIPAVSLAVNYGINDMSGDYLVSEYTKITAGNLKPNAIIISRQWDYFCSAFWYKQRIEHFRPDVVLIEKELLRRTWYLEQLKRWYPEVISRSSREMAEYLHELELFESGRPYDPATIQAKYIAMLNSFIEKNYDSHPIYMTLDIMEDRQDPIAQEYDKVPEGFAYRLEKESKVYPVSVGNINIDKFVKSLHNSKGYLAEGIGQAASINLTNTGRYAMATGQTAAANEAFRKASRINP